MSDNREIADSMMNALGYIKATTPADELRTAAARLRCNHAFLIQPPHGSLANPSPCKHCGMPYPADDEWIPERLREPLARLLEDVSDAMETADAEERDFPDHAPDYRRMVVDEYDEDRMDWTNALRLARGINGGAS